MQENAKKLNNWEEYVAKKLSKRDKQEVNELSVQQRRNPTTVSQMMAQIQDLQNKVNFLSGAREFYDPESGEQLWSDPRSWSNFYDSEFQNFAALRLWIAAKYTEFHRYYGKRFRKTTCSRRTILFYLQQFRDRQTWRQTADMKRESLNAPFQPPHFQNRSGILRSYWWNLFSRWYDGLSESSYYGMESWKISSRYGISKLEA